MTESSEVSYSERVFVAQYSRLKPFWNAWFRLLLLIISTIVLSATPSGAAGMTKGTEQKPFTPIKTPGDYVWKPEISPSGPVVILVSLRAQVLYVYRNGVRIGRSTISSGKPGYRTPTGVFTILQKSIRHTSTLYQGASMPYMERLTWGGVALHAGNLPGYPAAHGCIRLPLDFARQLYSVTSTGTTVIVTEGNSTPGNTREPGMILRATGGESAPPGIVIWKPNRAPEGPVSIIASSADSVIYVYRNGIEIGRAPIRGLNGIRGSYVYSALANIDATGRHEWQSTVSVGGRAPNIKKLVKKVVIDEQFLSEVRSLIKPGTTLVLTDSEVNENTRSAAGFGILIAKEAP